MSVHFNPTAMEAIPQSVIDLCSDSGNAIEVHKFHLQRTSLTMFIGNEGDLSTMRPGNGGCRLWHYATEKDAIEECRGLSNGMAKKHGVYNTGFRGAKLVVPINDVSKIHKKNLMEDVADVLNSVGGGGAVYTGCDLNITLDDMDHLMAKTPFVLASVGSDTDPNVATAYGVVGSLLGAFEARNLPVQGTRLFVLGCGAVGSEVSKIMASMGAHVLTSDLDASKADIAGCTNVSEEIAANDGRWFDVPCDVFCPCACSRIVTKEAIHKLSSNGCKLLCGASNLPFRCEGAYEDACRLGVEFIPEAVTSAGAVIVDSVEFYANAQFIKCVPLELYHFTRHLTRSKTLEIMRTADKYKTTPRGALPLTWETLKGSEPVGSRFGKWRFENTMRVDVLIAGGGIAGCAAAYELSKDSRQPSVMVCERGATVAPEDASSNGDSRMFRRMYSDPFYSHLQSDALAMWDEVERAYGKKLLKRHGLLFFGEDDTGETCEGSIPGCEEVMDKLKVDHDKLGSKAISARFNALHPRSNDRGLFEKGAGSILGSEACHAMASLASRRGVDLRFNAPLESMVELSSGGVFAAIGGENPILVHAGKLILSAGAWTNPLLTMLRGRPQLNLDIQSVCWGHYEMPREVATKVPQWFCFRKPDHSRLDGGLYYGFPVEEHELSKARPAVKVGIDYTPDGRAWHPATMRDFDYTPNREVAARIDEHVHEIFGGKARRRELVCSPYTVTPDQDFVLGYLPGHPDVAVFTGGSGRAFKFGPLLGKLLANTITGNKIGEEIAKRFNPARPSVWVGHLEEDELPEVSKHQAHVQHARM
ncbi:hypothetical protein PPROV_000517500 [Pycnococcus provasolii]|uniref:Glutamate/phenylalanine/leucine/valine/L-tryptophan dehydrogenase C-terminal domain-containing protein n=1 Tax=Pycnococcus provasolii TaxID=41880 RepID=A0A830HKS6_9CHLO|nr:hypothetical protein PPROV_000517500 [Pycnococcus provasolii]